jgi:predicted phosphoribosyltransferase
MREMQRRESLYRGEHPQPSLEDVTVIVVDDGLATGATMRAAVRAVKQMNPAEVIVAVPVGSHDTCEDLRKRVDLVVCAMTPEPFRAVGLWYEDFSQTTDSDVRDLLDLARDRVAKTG